MDDSSIFLRDRDDIGGVSFEHAERRTESQISNNVESESVEPIERIDDGVSLHSFSPSGSSLLGFLREFIPFFEEDIDGRSDVGFKFSY
jgi:hypothetical protein